MYEVINDPKVEIALSPPEMIPRRASGMQRCNEVSIQVQAQRSDMVEDMFYQ